MSSGIKKKCQQVDCTGESFNMSSSLLPKPQMRDLLGRIARRNFLIGVTLVTGSFFLLEHFFIQGRQNKYRDFYKTFDFAKDFEEKKKAGIFHSVKP
ncbi:cytochrome c oxidase subunit 6C isoform X1 [Pituophis catenifer annectens]|uniref:cytochrome c oxidase subunit 6C isoform X1 n=2 Tax=Pituophis catenifer annectens TaxID=94852 RepID=UPI0039940AC7